MSYLVLARKFRPQTFHSIVGQEHITTALATAIVRNKVPHALLFTGPRGVGKTSAARVFARALNCSKNTETDFSTLPEEEARNLVEPCGVCVNCKEIAQSSSVSVWEIDGASNNSVDNVRELIESLRSLPPPGSRYKIYIIDEVHMLSTAAFNALLKSLEEPPPNTIFIFATTEPHKIPETVISRCQIHDFRMLTPSIIVSCLKEIAREEKVEVEEQVFYFLAKRAEGGMRDAQSMLDRLLSFTSGKITLDLAQQVFGVLDQQFFFKLSKEIFNENCANCFVLLNEAFQQSINIRAFISDFITHFRNLLVVSVIREGKSGRSLDTKQLTDIFQISAEQITELQEQVQHTSGFDLQRLFDVAEKTGESAIISNFPRFVIEAGVAKMASLPSLRAIPEILQELRGGSQGVITPGKIEPTQRASALMTRSEPTELRSEVSDTKQVTAEPTGDFNPSWQDFVHHVQGRSEMVLATFLKRVSPVHFTRGVLSVKANAFDISALRDPNTIQTLKACLHSYSAYPDWEMKFSEQQGNEQQGEKQHGEEKAVERPIYQERKNKKDGAKPAEGSIVALQEKERRDLEKQVTDEARKDPLIQAALSTFEGSNIERVSVLKN